MDRYGSDRSRSLLGLALAAVNRGWTYEELYAALVDPKNRGGAKVQEIQARGGQPKARRYVRRLYDKARVRVQLRPAAADATSAEVCAARALVEQLRERRDVKWRGVGGATEFAVYQVHLETAERAGRRVYALDRRSVAQQIPCDDTTVTRCHRRLIARGLLRRERAGRGREASVWALLPPESAATAPTTLTLLPAPTGQSNGGSNRRFRPASDVDRAKDAFCWRHKGRAGVGLTKKRIYEQFLSEHTGASVAQLSERLGLSVRTVRDHLRALEGEGLAVRVGRGSWCKGVGDPAATAARLGTAGATSHRRDLNVAARLLHRAGRSNGTRVLVDTPERAARQEGGAMSVSVPSTQSSHHLPQTFVQGRVRATAPGASP